MKELMKGRQKATPTKPPAELEARPGDWDVPPQLFLACKVFRELSRKPTTDKYPGTLKLRTYEAGEVICRQGDSGWTAFVVLSDADVRAMYAEREKLLKDLQAKIEKDQKANKAEEVEKSKAQMELLRKAVLPPEGVGPAEVEDAAGVYLGSTREAAAKPSFFSWLFGSKPKPKEGPKFIPIDAPTTMDYGARKAHLKPGAIFGQWSCIYGAPRSATILADRRCFVLEMLRNVLDGILRDEKFQEASDREYISSILENHLAGLPLFRDLTEAELKKVQELVKSGDVTKDEQIQLKRYRDGQLVFDAGDPPDGIYIVRRGLVKVLVNAWPLLTADDLLDPERLREAVLEPGKLPVPVSLPEQGPAALVAGLNGLIKDRALTGVAFKAGKRSLRKELAGLMKSDEFMEVWEGSFPEDPADWVDQEWRRFNRLVLEVLFPRLIRRAADKADPEEYRRLGTEQVRTYLKQGDYFGEIGVLKNTGRTATCVAYVHPRPPAAGEEDACAKWRREEERVELVLLPKMLLVRLCQSNPKIGAQLIERVKQYQEADRKAPSVASSEAAGRVFQSPEFQRQGLIQGQKLMLIDLDRCTRCDECVKACIDSHDDGRTRLFLDGPRFGKYLVPTTCRACRDPVCLIGCPVGSIRRGNNLEMVIEDWCIGCQLCATNCPYGSIQMHDLGLVPEQAHGWRFTPAAGLKGDAWTGPGYVDAGWDEGAAPFWWDADLKRAVGGEGAIAFRHEFTLPADAVTRPRCGLKLVIDSKAAEVQVEGTGRATKIAGFLPVWLNGAAVPLEQWKLQQGQYVLEALADDRGKWFRAGRNTIAVRATPGGQARELLLQVALDRVEESGAVIAERAVVCDQCSSSVDRVAACVHACPHDAAMRVDAWANFPVK